MMKQKAFALLGFFAVLVMALSMVSAMNVSLSSSALTVYNGSSTFTILTVGNNDSVNSINVTSIYGTVPNTALTIVANVTSFELAPNMSKEVLITLSAPSNQVNATSSGTIIVSSNATSSISTPVTVTAIQKITSAPTNNSAIIADLCDGLSYTTSEIKVSNEDNNKVDNDNEWEWRPLDNTEIEFEIENNAADDDDHEYDIELFFFKNGEDVTDQIVSDEDTLVEDGFDVDNGKDENVLLAFQIDGETEEYSNVDVWVAVKELDNDVCYAKLLNDASIDKNSKQVIVKNVDTTTSVKAGETMSLEVEVANIGKQDEDKVKVVLYNKDLGLNLYKEIDDVSEGDTATATFLVTIPATAKQGSYKLLFSTEFDYDSDDEEYGEESDTDDDYTKTITVFGMTSAPTIGAKLVSSATVGKTLQVDVSLTNNGDADETYDLIVEGASWANNAKFAEDSVLVKAGETEVVRLTLIPQEDGAQDFTIKAVYGDEIKKQTVSVNIASGSSITNIFAGIGTMGYLIGAIVVLAILILIVAIVKLSRPRRRVESIAY